MIFNYGELKWPNENVNKSVQIGFNDGFKWYYSFDGVFTRDVTDAQNTSNVHIPGKWVFRIDEEGKFEISDKSSNGLI